jgi:hypothetical protein
MIIFNKPDNCYTVWQLYKNHGINKQRIYRAIKSGEINGFMEQTEEFIELKWYIKNDELLMRFIEKNAKSEVE